MQEPVGGLQANGNGVPCRAQIDFAQTGTTTCVVVAGELDLATVPKLRDALLRPRPPDAEHVVIDLKRVTFMDSAGLHALMDAHDHWGERLRIRLGTVAARLVDITALRDRLPIIDTDTPLKSSTRI